MTRADDPRGNGVSRGFLSYDHRSFGDLISDWQSAAGPGAPDLFIREALGLEGSLSRGDFLRLIAGDLAPSHELVLLASARVPECICTPLVMRHRGERAISANRGGRLPSVEIPEGAVRRSRLRRVEEIASGRRATLGEASGFADLLVERLQERTSEPLDAKRTLANIERFLNVPPGTLRGQAALPPAEASRVSEALAMLLDIRETQFDAFADEAARALAAGSDARGAKAGTFGTVLRFLRHGAGLTQSEVCSRLDQGGAWWLARHYADAERGYIPDPASIQSLCRALGYGPDEGRVLDAIAERERPEMARHPNIKETADRFAADGVAREAYLGAALKQPQLFCRNHETIAGNIDRVVEHFAGLGLTREAYLKAAVKQPSLFGMRSSTIAGNFDRVVERFAADGLTREAYLKAALKQPSLFTMSPATIARNIEGVVGHFAAQGLTTRDYIESALRQTTLFTMSPGKVVANVEGVVEGFAADGLTREAYLQAAVKQPQLFYQSPGTIARHINIVIGFAQEGIFTPPRSRRASPSASSDAGPQATRAAVITFLLAHPSFLSLSEDNLGLREAHQRLTDGPTNGNLIRKSRHRVERELMAHLGHDDPGRPVPAAGPIGGEDSCDEEHARRFLLRALIHAGRIRSGTMDR
jgi:transcriptional regulator with XRE-family HTH domain